LYTTGSTVLQCRVVHDEIDSIAFGSFEYGRENPMIKINPKARLNYVDDCGIVVHERTHASEENLLFLKDNYKDNQLAYEFLTLLSANINRIEHQNTFGMKIDGQLYIDVAVKSDSKQLEWLSSAFYRLSIVERYARRRYSRQPWGKPCAQ
jgi:hypothetical protein